MGRSWFGSLTVQNFAIPVGAPSHEPPELPPWRGVHLHMLPAEITKPSDQRFGRPSGRVLDAPES
eukprot:8543448-Alexandrium_andersonii.AAC.1